jgi:serine/threonine protein kinase
MDNKHKVCIADFGLAQILGESGFTMKTVGGTYQWMAPELLAAEGVCVLQVTMASDVWAFGIMGLEVRLSVSYF